MIDYNRRGCWLQLVNFAIRGHDVRTSMNRTFFLAHGQAFLLRPRACPRVLGCGARRGAACTPRRKFGPRPGSVARAPGPQSRASWQAITGSHSALPSNAGHWKPHFKRFLLLLLHHVCITPRPSSSQVLYFVAAMVEQQSLIKFFPHDGNGRCICVCACVCHASGRPRK